MTKLSLTEENYLKAIYFIGGTSNQLVNTNAIAERLNTKAATVTDMLRKLKQKDLIEYQPYKGTRLKLEGKVKAIGILRKHRLWETFLVEKLAFGWEEVHEMAEQLEHIQSAELTERLSAFLGFPEFDPHGDPIPNKEGVFPRRDNVTLDRVSPDTAVMVQGVKDSSTEFLNYIAKLGIQLGDHIAVKSVEEFDRSLVVEHKNQQYRLSALAAANLYIKEL
jgi:DtxR family Mn-dependent transcriptional regulator